MSTDVSQIQLGDIAVDVVLKDIKNVHLSVHPPTGRVRISAPKRMRLDTIIGRMDAAIAMYRKLGFREIAPYYENPIPGALYLEKVLG